MFNELHIPFEQELVDKQGDIINGFASGAMLADNRGAAPLN
jgi:hypothetical protein